MVGLHDVTLAGLAYLLSATVAYAGSCSQPVRLDGPGGTMENVPVRDQSSLGICFAESTAEVLSAVQRKLHVKNFVEPSAMAIAAGLSAKNGNNAFTHGGDPCDAMAYAEKNGVCSVDDVEDRNDDSSGQLSQNINPIAVQGLQNEFDRLQPADQCGPKAPVIGITNDKSLLAMLENQSCDTQGTYQAVTKNCKKTSSDPNYQDPIKNLNLTCKRFPDEKSAASGQTVTPSQYAQELNQLLDGPNPLPTIIGFCSKILTDPSQPGGAPASKDSCGGHAALVIGRREVNGKCQFLLRNSWGTECDHYLPELQSQCEPGKGNIWVDADTLTKNTLEVIPPPL